MPSGPTGDHLFVILFGPSALKNYGAVGQLISVSITSIYPGLPYDQACVLQPDDHPFIKHPSYVLYRRARIDPIDHFDKMVCDGVWKPQVACSPITFEKINRGACVSKLISREIKAFLGGV